MVEHWCSQLQRGGHRGYVGLHQQVIGEIRQQVVPLGAGYLIVAFALFVEVAEPPGRAFQIVGGGKIIREKTREIGCGK